MLPMGRQLVVCSQPSAIKQRKQLRMRVLQTVKMTVFHVEVKLSFCLNKATQHCIYIFLIELFRTISLWQVQPDIYDFLLLILQPILLSLERKSYSCSPFNLLRTFCHSKLKVTYTKFFTSHYRMVCATA